MKRSTYLACAALFVAAACDEETSKPTALTTAPQIAPAAVAASGAVAAAVTGGSTICRVYVTERDVAKSALDAAPADTLLQRRVTTLDALVNETCN
jgi:hypothetical protein